ncbi:MAG: anthranilate phosphoribosyltransferase [Planctomycetes bacterium]|nr:anthranilate phosphoribosyltransferase [Planctomycetota bacterium]
MTPAEAIARVVDRRDLSAADAESVLVAIMGGEATPAQIGALLVALRMKGETIDEVEGFARAMRSLAMPAAGIPEGPLLDTCGTGGDGLGTFNVSTAAAFVAAGAGARVAKHGNRASSSRSGSADCLAALGVDVEAAAGRVARSLDEASIAFLFAPAFHSALRFAAAPRREIGIRSVMNLIGPLTNPAGASHQLVGIYRADLLDTVAHVLAHLGARRAIVVAARDGMDEVSTIAVTDAVEWDGHEFRRHAFDPRALGFPMPNRDALLADSPRESAGIVRRVLEGERGAPRDLVVLNAAVALIAAGRATDVPSAIEAAVTALDSGRAMECLERLRRIAPIVVG